MYLRKLYRHHKGWFLFVVLFIAAQLFINFKHGVVSSPFYHYGMYSAVIKPQKIYIIPEIVVNGKTLQTKNFSPQQWDKIILPVTLNDQQQQWNSNLYHSTIQRLLHVSDSSIYINQYSSTSFQLWYQQYLETVLGQKVDSLKINFNILSYSHQQLKPFTQP